jgi:hypothetical protein
MKRPSNLEGGTQLEARIPRALRCQTPCRPGRNPPQPRRKRGRDLPPRTAKRHEVAGVATHVSGRKQVENRRPPNTCHDPHQHGYTEGQPKHVAPRHSQDASRSWSRESLVRRQTHSALGPTPSPRTTSLPLISKWPSLVDTQLALTQPSQIKVCPRPESNQCTRFRKSRASVRRRASVSAESLVSGSRCPPGVAEYASLCVVQACPGRRLVDGSRCAYVSSESTLAQATALALDARRRRSLRRPMSKSASHMIGTRNHSPNFASAKMLSSFSECVSGDCYPAFWATPPSAGGSRARSSSATGRAV